MKIELSIALLQNVENIDISLHGEFNLINQFNKSITKLKDCNLKINLTSAAPAKCDWYKKIETFYTPSEIDKFRTKYKYQDKKIRIIKAGKNFDMDTNFDNFEYWVLQKLENYNQKISSHIPTHIKPIIKRENFGKFTINGEEFNKKTKFIPCSDSSFFTVNGVRVGVEFHWEHKENLSYQGRFEIKTSLFGKLLLVNTLDIEDYLASVNSSEMREDNHPEMLKAQTVAARSTVLATAGKHHYSEGFDLCNDDHCQCYQGINRITEMSKKVTKATEGEILFSENRIVDARYSKICGGITEKFSTCWEDQNFIYLQSYPDNTKEPLLSFHKELSNQESKALIDDKEYDCFCNTKKYTLPKSLEFCVDNFRWQETLTIKDLEANIKERFPDKQIGKVVDLEIIERGTSGRIKWLNIIGTKNSFKVGKELQIRRILSTTHLRSSCLYFEKVYVNQNLFAFKINGAGWGHGVGLCQVGAQVMAQEGYNYIEICKHYYRISRISKIN